MNTLQQRQQDREDAVRYAEAAMHLRSFARHYDALMAEVLPQQGLHTFAVTAAVFVRNSYEDMACWFRTAAEQADEMAAQAREQLGISA